METKIECDYVDTQAIVSPAQPLPPSRPPEPLYKLLASAVDTYRRCIEHGNTEWKHNHAERIVYLVKEHMPSGSGIDRGTTLDLDASTGERLVFDFSFHHMDDGGMYDGWTDHKCVVTPFLVFGFNLRITGRDRNQVKEYLHDTYHHALVQLVERGAQS